MKPETLHFPDDELIDAHALKGGNVHAAGFGQACRCGLFLFLFELIIFLLCFFIYFFFFFLV